MDVSMALFAYENTISAFPVCSTQPFENKPGSLDEKSAAGYSWLVRLTPFMDGQSTFWDGLNWHSKKLTVPPFAPDLKTIVQEKEIHPASHSFPEFLCPSYDGDRHVLKEDSEYRPIAGQMPAVASYHAFAGSHFTNSEGSGKFPITVTNNRAPFTGDGSIPFPRDEGKKPYYRGVRLNSIVDGASQTLLFAESLEPAYAAYIDGQAMWLVAAWPGNEKTPSLKPDPSTDGVPILGWDAADKENVKASIGLRNPDGSMATYLAADRWSGSHDRRWGPSSNHPGVVGHTFADGHGVMLPSDIDPEVYLYMATHSGQETVPQATMDQLRRGTAPRNAP